MTLEAHFDLLEIEDKYKDDIDTMEINNFWIPITSIRHRTPTIPVDHTPDPDAPPWTPTPRTT